MQKANVVFLLFIFLLWTLVYGDPTRPGTPVPVSSCDPNVPGSCPPPVPTCDPNVPGSCSSPVGGTGGSGDAQVKAALKEFCGLVYGLIPLVALTMVLTASVVYAAGQFFGAETRARANVWATSMLAGALIGIIIIVIVPWLLHIAYPSADLNNACGTGPIVV